MEFENGKNIHHFKVGSNGVSIKILKRYFEYSFFQMIQLYPDIYLMFGQAIRLMIRASFRDTQLMLDLS